MVMAISRFSAKLWVVKATNNKVRKKYFLSKVILGLSGYSILNSDIIVNK